ncbi:GDP-mannose mannosyl hydrolase [Psychrobacter sp. HII-4]|uniref:GDP-mannose mannosyl hydrolase n=1 Tax=Psychrobacter sp. HII-4 TaxID=1569264 RepID=UPI001917ECD8|nr:GDP-mannose mannosyl hydrolase [Psychrobacter sp. HII-4]
MYLDDSKFEIVIQNTPLVSIDLIIKNAQGQVLLGRRNNRPAQGYWFVPGGRIRKNETLAQAFKRLTCAELAQEFLLGEACFLGVFEHLYADSVFDSEISTHYIALGYQLIVDVSFDTLPLDQHHKYQWFAINDLLNDAHVHENTKAYF